VTRFVVVDATALSPEPSGARRRLTELLSRLSALLPDDVFEVHWARDGGGPGDGLSAANLVHVTTADACRGGLRRWLSRRRALLRRHHEAAYTHLLLDHGPVVTPPGVRVVVTVHDLRFLHGYGGRLRALYGRRAYGRALARASRVVAVSPSVARELADRYGLRDVAAVGNAPSAAFAPPPPGAARRGALVVARDEPRKARGAAVAAAAAAGVPLTVVEGGLPDPALADRYRAAAWLLAPSLLEGYDLPVVEALASGTPVLASRIPAHEDLVGEGARGVVLLDPPRREGEGWVWPGAAEALRGSPPAEVSAPGGGWDERAARLRDVLVG
jgi:glycosyltransferase involved in cell wall biosynthesis